MNQLRRIHASGSQDRLDRLIRKCLAPDADNARIDQPIWATRKRPCVVPSDSNTYNLDRLPQERVLLCVGPLLRPRLAHW